MNSKKTDENIVPKDFTLSLVLVDALPVLLFCVWFAMIACSVNRPLFWGGMIAVVFAGICKVLWKLIVVINKRSIPFLKVQMRISMPIGFMLILLSLFSMPAELSIVSLWHKAVCSNAAIFFVLGAAGMIMMGVYAGLLDHTKLSCNWIEQITNTLAQLCILIGICIMKG